MSSMVLSYVPLRSKTTFVSNIFSENASLKKYFGAIFKMGHPVEERLKNKGIRLSKIRIWNLAYVNDLVL